MRVMIAAFLVGMMPSVALADLKAAEACAQGLSPEAKQIFDSVVAIHPAPDQGRATVISVTERMVGEGKIRIWEARPAGEAAGQCLEMIVQ